jgi:hypothetical protein
MSLISTDLLVFQDSQDPKYVDKTGNKNSNDVYLPVSSFNVKIRSFSLDGTPKISSA